MILHLTQHDDTCSIDLVTLICDGRVRQTPPAKNQTWIDVKRTHSQSRRLRPDRALFLLGSAVQLTCAVCLRPPDARLLRFARARLHAAMLELEFVSKLRTSAVCSSSVTVTNTAHIFIQPHWCTGFSSALTIIHSPVKVCFAFISGPSIHSN